MKNKNTQNNTGSIILVALIVLLAFGGVYWLGRSSAPSSPSASFEDLPGKPAPAFSLKDGAGNVYSNETLKGKKILLFFNEGIMCYPSCWNQMLSLVKNPRFKRSDTVLLSVVVDSPSEWKSAISKMPELDVGRMAFDENKKVSKVFGVLVTPSSMHYGSYPGHSYVIIDKEGIVRYTYDDPRMSINDDLIADELEKLN